MPETGYDIAWGIATPAFEKPIPAIEAAMDIIPRACSSSGFSIDRMRYFSAIRVASNDQMSLIGLDP
jgi:hypothetical protein